MVRVGDHQGAIPVQSDKGPRQGTGHDRRVNEPRIRVVAEIEGGQVEEVENQDHLSPVEVGSDEEHHEGKVEQIVQDEVAADAGGSLNNVGVAREEVADVSSLENEEYNPEPSLLAFEKDLFAEATYQ